MYFLYSKVTLFFLLTFGLNSVNASFFHPLHVSTTEISFNRNQKSVEISCKIFTDDFENALRKQNKSKIDLSMSTMHDEMDLIVKKYIETHLQIKINDQKQIQNYIGFEIIREAVVVYLEIKNEKPFKKTSINNRILVDSFEDQMNLVHVEHLGKRKSGSLNSSNSLLEFEF